MAENASDLNIRPGYEQRQDARNDPRLDWWRDARFGMFIHWGLYAMPHERWSDYPDTVTHHWTGEWVQHVKRIPNAVYHAAADDFNPVGFDAAEWVSLAREAGMRYMVITAKHHDGFCLFDSEVTDFNIVRATPFGRDVIAELSDECRRQELPFGVYYSQTQDWSQPDGEGNNWDFDPAERGFPRYIEQVVQPHLRELLGNYGPIGLVWFDTPMGMSLDQSRHLVDYVHHLQPSCLVSGRIGNGLGDYASFRDNRFPGAKQAMDWESPATMNRTWGYVPDDHAWKSSQELLWTLIDTASKGGNFLLNVGPDGLGVIPEPSQKILRRMGSWLGCSGEGIYATGASEIEGGKFARVTQTDQAVYLHVITWPLEGRLKLPEELAAAQSVEVVATDETIPVQTGDDSQAAVQLPRALLPALPVTLRVRKADR
ncbi:MAG: alpha-L-fucosidase [Phycisphaerae bacterium]